MIVPGSALVWKAMSCLPLELALAVGLPLNISKWPADASLGSMALAATRLVKETATFVNLLNFMASPRCLTIPCSRDRDGGRHSDFNLGERVARRIFYGAWECAFTGHSSPLLTPSP